MHVPDRSVSYPYFLFSLFYVFLSLFFSAGELLKFPEVLMY